ncbi:hypothetical protein BKA65DRAFT_539930 [Rhexocercosporidium sp. MPI-PUGE-AT-0058]|nr:hypothetical protein BKA65DRAFT_539930 [Rhexocercosporidium sp. MPI-PUGE-AT-0058]
MNKQESEAYLHSLISKTLRVTTTDTRMFLGQFKCTDSDRNIILSHTYEYRRPPPPKSTPSSSSTSPVVLDMTSRFLGLVVVPGEYITRIEVEEFESQMKGKGMVGKMVGEGLKEREKEKEPFCAGGVCDEDS